MKGSSPNTGSSLSQRKLVQLNLGQASVSMGHSGLDRWSQHCSCDTETSDEPWSFSELLQGLVQEEERGWVMARQRLF